MNRLNQIITNIALHEKALFVLKQEYESLVGEVSEQELKFALAEHELEGMKINANL